MIYSVITTTEAEEDLREIYEYIAFALQSPDAASGQLDRLEEAILSPSELPCRFRNYDSRIWRKRKLHVMPVDNYCVFYIPDDIAAIVTITRIIYGARDFHEVLESSAA